MICFRGRTSCLTFAKRKFEVCWSRVWLQLCFCLTAVVERLLINTAVLILHRRAIYQKKKPTGTIIPMSFSSCFPHDAYHLHATSHPHFTIFVFSTHKNSKNIKTGWKDNKVKLQLRLLFLCFRGRKLDDRNARKLGGY